jgi:hypothetical protein
MKSATYWVDQGIITAYLKQGNRIKQVIKSQDIPATLKAVEAHMAKPKEK